MGNPQNARAVVSQVEGLPVLARLPGLVVKQSQLATLTLTLRDRDGTAVDLTAFGFRDGQAVGQVGQTIVAKLQDAIALSLQDPILTLPAAVSAAAGSAAAGSVDVPLTPDAVATPLVFGGEAGVLDAASNLLFSQPFFLAVNRGLFGTPPQGAGGGPPAVEEMRLRLRDSDDNDSYLLTHREFDDAELCQAYVHVVRVWNDARPPIKLKYRTGSFPYTEPTYDGIMGVLYQVAAAHYRREHVPYQAGGVTFQDKDKAKEYEALAQERLGAYRHWVLMAKAGINVMGGFGGIRSDYAGLG